MHRLWWRFVRFGFHLLYNEFAWTYDLVAWVVSFGQWKAWGRTTIPHLEGERVLELAHGPGHLLVAMAERGLSPVGLDLSPYMSRQARRRLLKSDGLTIPLVRARAQALPFRDGCFDSTVATFPSEYIMARETLRGVARVLKPEGRLVVAGGVFLSGWDPLSRFIWWLYRITGQGDVLVDRAKTMLARTGFSAHITWEEAKYNSRVLLVTAEKGQEPVKE
jgi:ubiquinone/menaquinone biosynthesis C-methylase UbiE